MQIIYSRDHDGNVPVHVLGNGQFEIHRPESPPVVCDSARQLIITLTGHPKARNWTFDRYFRLGLFSLPETLIETASGSSILEMFEPGGIVLDSGLSLPTGHSSASLTIQVGGPQLGIDLDARGGEVAKLLFAGFKGWIFSAGYDPQDVLQEVYKGILIRNRGICPFDARKASFGHYVHRICECVLSNYHRREARRKNSEQTGMSVIRNGKRVDTDVAEGMAEAPGKSLACGSSPLEQDLVRALSRRPTEDNRVALRLVPLLGCGYTQGDLAEILQVSRPAISNAMETIRNTTVRCGYAKTRKDRQI